jgi:tRNA nucleotidyltransferase (CCA-adding enzyme)
VGGAVRDALLGLPPGPDLDLVAEGDALPVARRLAAALGARLVVHPRFGTAALELPGGVRVDLATARRERYPAPGALPEVEPGTLDDDLARRDLTINAIALAVAGPAAGELRDPHGGLADLRAGLVRALREDAFLEDPSRLLRAARYAARLGFALAPQTAAAARAAAAAASAGSARVGEELRRLLAEPAPVAAGGVAIAAGLGVPWLVDRPDAEALAAEFAALDAALGREGAPPLAAWALRLGRAVRGERLPAAAVPGWARAVAAGAGEGAALADRLSDPALAPSTVDGILRGAPAAAQVAALAAGAEPVARWWSRWRDLAPEVGGADLVAAGVPPGPAMGRALRAVRAAVLDGRVGGRDEQLALALRLVAEEG